MCVCDVCVYAHTHGMKSHGFISILVEHCRTGTTET